MKALITGASSGLGREMARLLAARGYELILCARREERLRELAAELPVPCRVIAADVSDEQECRLLYEAVQSEELEVVINNAGFGLFGEFVTADLDEELCVPCTFSPSWLCGILCSADAATFSTYRPRRDFCRDR